MQECTIKLKQPMSATISLCEFYGGQFFRKMIHSFLNLIYSSSARLASAMQIVTELCLTDTCKFFQTSKREYPSIFRQKTCSVIVKLKFCFREWHSFSGIICFHFLVCSTKILNGSLHCNTLTDTPVIKRRIVHICRIARLSFFDKYFQVHLFLDIKMDVAHSPIINK